MCRTTLSAKIQPKAAKPVAQPSWIITPKRNRIFFSILNPTDCIFQLLQTNLNAGRFSNSPKISSYQFYSSKPADPKGSDDLQVIKGPG